VLVHGAAADHTTWRVVGPRLAQRFSIWTLDRRGRGASGDGPEYAVEREFEDVAAVAAALAGDSGAPIPVVGHSFGGRVALGAATLAPAIGRLVVYEGAPSPPDRPYQAADLVGRLAALRDAGAAERLLETFLAEVVGMSDADLTAYRANPVWPDRVAAAPTIVRELQAEASPAAGLEALGRVGVPVLQLLGSASRAPFHAATAALAERLPRGQVALIDGARHAAHHTHPDRFVAEVLRFLDQP
jgi:pimeloyl-ACP methyl ester carboxylesterase